VRPIEQGLEIYNLLKNFEILMRILVQAITDINQPNLKQEEK